MSYTIICQLIQEYRGRT